MKNKGCRKSTVLNYYSLFFFLPTLGFFYCDVLKTLKENSGLCRHTAQRSIFTPHVSTLFPKWNVGVLIHRRIMSDFSAFVLFHCWSGSFAAYQCKKLQMEKPLQQQQLVTIKTQSDDFTVTRLNMFVQMLLKRKLTTVFWTGTYIWGFVAWWIRVSLFFCWFVTWWSMTVTVEALSCAQWKWFVVMWRPGTTESQGYLANSSNDGKNNCWWREVGRTGTKLSGERLKRRPMTYDLLGSPRQPEPETSWSNQHQSDSQLVNHFQCALG